MKKASEARLPFVRWSGAALRCLGVVLLCDLRRVQNTRKQFVCADTDPHEQSASVAPCVCELMGAPNFPPFILFALR